MNRMLPPRRLIPQWRKASFAVHQPDMLGLVNPVKRDALPSTNQDVFSLALNSWNHSKSVGDLADLLSFGVDTATLPALIGPAKTALALAEASPVMKLVAENILAVGSSEAEVWDKGTLNEQVGSIRKILRMAPNDTIALVELAQHHLTNGNIKRAYRCLATATQISPNSVYVIRAVARFWVHIGQPDRAHNFIKKSKLVEIDPWLMASEIALAQVAKAPSSFLKKAQRAIAVNAFSSRDITELAAAVGDAELNNGKLKEARKLFRTALDAPNDNVLAQAIQRQDTLGIDIDETVLRRASNGVFEGRAYKAFLETDFEAASGLAAQWGGSEPFSSRPKMFESYLYGAMGRYDQSLAAALTGLRAEPDDLMLRGNKADALAGLRRFDAASMELKGIAAKNNVQFVPFLSATLGMIEILNGAPDEGIVMYEEAIALFSARRDEESVTTCRAFLARAASTAKLPQSDALVRAAKERFSKNPAPAAAVILRTLNQAVDTSNTASLRKVAQWEWDSEKNVLFEKRELSRKGAAGFQLKTTPRK